MAPVGAPRTVARMNGKPVPIDDETAANTRCQVAGDFAS